MFLSFGFPQPVSNCVTSGVGVLAFASLYVEGKGKSKVVTVHDLKACEGKNSSSTVS